VSIFGDTFCCGFIVYEFALFMVVTCEFIMSKQLLAWGS